MRETFDNSWSDYILTQSRGWQFQPKFPSVQGELEAALKRRLQYPVRVVGASRTDTGVHARGQAIHFDVPEELSLGRSSKWKENVTGFEHSINHMLSNEVRIFNVEEAQAESPESQPWHAIACATGKWYAYRFHVGPIMDPTERLYRYSLRWKLDFAKMEKALCGFVGKHDFASFANVATDMDYDVRCTERRISSARLVEEGNGCYRLDFTIDGALYRMIRNIVGFLFAVGSNKMNAHDLDDIFRARDRRRTPKSAPAQGLCLEEVFYNKPQNPGSSLVIKNAAQKPFSKSSFKKALLQ